MPAPPRPAPPAGTARMVVESTYFGESIYNVLWARLTSLGSPNPADTQSICNSLWTAWTTNMKTHLSSSLTFTNITLTYTPTLGSEIVAAAGGSVAGSVVGTAINDVSGAYVLDWLIGQYYRGGHPRSYLGGVDNGTISNGRTVSGTLRTNLAADAAAFLGAVALLSTGDVSKVEIGTVSFVHNKAWRSPPVFWPYTGAKVRTLLGTQRRRIR